MEREISKERIKLIAPIKPIECCPKGKAYVSLAEFKELGEEVTDIDTRVTAIEEGGVGAVLEDVAYSISGTEVYIEDNQPGVYFVCTDLIGSPSVRASYTFTIMPRDSGGSVKTIYSPMVTYQDQNFAYRQVFLQVESSTAIRLHQMEYTNSQASGIGFRPGLKVYRIKTP